MWEKRNNLLTELAGIQAQKQQFPSLNYQRIINSQQEMIKLLQKQITYLRQYLSYVADFQPSNLDLKFDLSISTDDKSQTFTTEKSCRKINSLKTLINDVMSILKVSVPDEVIPNLKKLNEKAHEKVQPVFVPQVKEKQVPVYVQKIKEVQKPVIREKIIYEEKIVYLDKGGDNKEKGETKNNYNEKGRKSYHQCKFEAKNKEKNNFKSQRVPKYVEKK